MLTLGPDRGSVAQARHWVLRRASEAGVAGETGAVVELLTSEIVANAVVHGPDDGSITVRTRAARGRFLVEVLDDAPQAPVVRHTDPLDEGGRGMMLVDMLAADWGVRPHPGDGKTVWFRVAI
jgi:anti-sigma regulatory factor (Ser/Thr protein kinase)